MAIKTHLKKLASSLIRKVMSSSLFREELYNIVEDHSNMSEIIRSIKFNDIRSDYPDIGTLKATGCKDRKGSIFITSRFRAGSTFLWNVFRNISGFTAYYEPLLHEAPHERGKAKKYATDPTHTGVKDYHSEFLNIDGLSEVHDPNWAFKKLYMDEYDFDIRLERFIDLLINNAKGRPVLQFNRVDFRLKWLRIHYPSAFILHLYRHPRDQWLSMINNDQYIPKNYTLDKQDLYQPINTFYMMDWWRDLHVKIPILDIRNLDHPYQIHYLLWRLSYLFGRTYSNLSISYEALTNSFESTMSELMSLLKFDHVDLDDLKRRVKLKKLKSTWNTYADHDWFKGLEEECEHLLSSFLRFHEK
jgi:hypothetical protein